MTLEEFLSHRKTLAAIRVEDAAQLLGISKGSAFAAAKSGELPSIRIGRRIVVPAAKIAEMLGLPEAA